MKWTFRSSDLSFLSTCLLLTEHQVLFYKFSISQNQIIQFYELYPHDDFCVIFHQIFWIPLCCWLNSVRFIAGGLKLHFLILSKHTLGAQNMFQYLNTNNWLDTPTECHIICLPFKIKKYKRSHSCLIF